jgi:hypothetical protein
MGLVTFFEVVFVDGFITSFSKVEAYISSGFDFIIVVIVRKRSYEEQYGCFSQPIGLTNNATFIRYTYQAIGKKL